MDTSHLRSLTLSKLLCQDGFHDNNEKPVKINKQNVQNLVEGFWKLNSNEKLLFLVNLGERTPPTPTATTPLPTSTTTPPLAPPSSSRLTSTTNWLTSNFTPDPSTALPKEEVYDYYLKTFEKEKHISTADFGKLMRAVFPSVKARRLGQRGASKYCYANIRKKSHNDVDKPQLAEININIFQDYLNWGKASFGVDFENLETLLSYLKSGNFKSPRKRRNSSFSKKKEDQEISKYFESSRLDDWPQLRNLLDKKRHCSDMTTDRTLQNEISTRSASVPIYDQTSGRFITMETETRLESRSGDSGYDSVGGTPIEPRFDAFNPLLCLGSGEEEGGGVSVEEGGGVLFDSVFDLIVDERIDEGVAGGWFE